jgi:hypothetical protein
VPRKLSTTTLVLILFTLTLILSIAGIFVIVSIFHPTYAVYATKLNDKPSSYFIFNNPDKYVLEAISNEHSSFFNSLDYTQIDELTDDYGTNNIEYNSTYYAIGMICGDKFPPFMLPQILFAGVVVSVTAIAIICLSKTAKYINKQND